MANEVQEAWREFTSTVRSTLVVVLKYDVKRQSLTDAVVLLAVQNLEDHVCKVSAPIDLTLTCLVRRPKNFLRLMYILVVEFLKPAQDVTL